MNAASCQSGPTFRLRQRPTPIGSWVLALFLATHAAVGAELPIAELGGSQTGRVEAPAEDCGQILFNADLSYENGYTWQYSGIVPPDYGAFAEGYGVSGIVCAAHIDLSQVGNQISQVLDVYVWDDDGGLPGAVLYLLPGQDPGGVAFWPSLSRHTFPVDATPDGSWWIGYWGSWPGQVGAYFVGADLDGPGGFPMTKIAPGLGFPTGWQNVSVAWGPTQAIAIGAELIGGDFGACCYEDGRCVLSAEENCDGVLQGPETNCVPNPCPQPPEGACCFPDGSCELHDEFDCATLGGSYFGAETPCDPNPCPQPPKGACCFPNGNCVFVDAFDCEALDGSYLGDDIICTPNPCPQPPDGACCLNSGSCIFIDMFECAIENGEYQGDGIPCDPNPCVPGACCFEDGSCGLVIARDCDAAGGDFLGPDESCSPNPCPQPPVGACCFPNGNCQTQDRFDCADGNGDYLGDGVLCDPNPCPQPPEGACCLPNDNCVRLDEFECADQGGAYLGETVLCDPNPCLEGACCLGDGSCVVGTPIDCDEWLGEYQGAETSCDPNPCPQPPTGACCLGDGSCETLTDFDCEQAGGIFYGEGELCENLNCPVLCPSPEPVRPSKRSQRNRVGAGPNSGGTLIIHHNEALQFTSVEDFCNESELFTCADAQPRVDRSGPVIFHVLSAFPSTAESRLAGVTFGINYPDCVILLAAGHCGDFEVDMAEWPDPETGTAVTWTEPQTSNLVEVYWFAGYVFDDQVATVSAIPHPIQGGYFGDDSIPSILDPITGYGVLGFFGPGSAPCPDPEGACCLPDGLCEIVFESECVTQGGQFLGVGTTCDPNPCSVVPTIDSSWGQLKHRFR